MRSRFLSFAFAASLLIGSAAASAAEHNKPQRVMSINLCTDQLVLQLLPPDRITSVTYLSRFSSQSYLSAEAVGVAINYGTSEEVLRQHPDLILAGDFSTPATRALAAKAGIPLLVVPAAENFDEIRKTVRTVAHAVGVDETGQFLIEHMDATLAELAATVPTQRIVVAGWNGGGNVPGKDTLFDTILTAAGGINIAARFTPYIYSSRMTSFDLEQLVQVRPDVLAFGNARVDRLDLSREQLQHPVVQKLYRGKQITYPDTLYSCGLPQSADAARLLRQALLAAMTGEALPP